MEGTVVPKYKSVIAEIGSLNWPDLDTQDLTAVAMAYYHFSIQFRENLMTAVSIFPHDINLQLLKAGECYTANLSPWPLVAELGERMNHDEFMRRVLLLSPLAPETRKMLDDAGANYLQRAHQYDPDVRARSIASYEDGGLETTFRAMLTAPNWDTPTLEGFRHFLIKHISFDSDPEGGHGALSRHLQADDRVLPLWEDFRDLLIYAAPRLSTETLRQAG